MNFIVVFFSDLTKRSASKFFAVNLFSGFTLLSVLSLQANAQTYPGTIKIPATFYDFHSDGSNPEFDCERHVTSSDILIETNIFSQLAFVQIYRITPSNPSDTTHRVGPLDSAFAGTPFNLAAHFFDSTGTLRSDLDNQITWTMTDLLGTIITKLNGDTTTLIPIKAYGTATLTATLTTTNGVYSQTIQIYIGSGKPNRINIQNSPVITSLWSDQKLGTLTMNENTPNSNLYAVIRDSVGNYIDSANTAIWKSSDISYATVSPGIKRWQGIVTKVKAGIILIIASSPGVVPDTVVVTLLTPHIIDTPSIAPADNKPGCGCGSGTGLAFIPPLGFKAKSWWNRKRKGRGDKKQRKATI